ncbi:hypothetical protein ABBQ38_000318 [Trebouxia sp. C0009 RCD-2024]
MRLQTISTRNSGYLGHVSLLRGSRRPPVVRYFHIIKTVDQVSRRHAPVKRKWHISSSHSGRDRSRSATTKPHAASADNAVTSQRTRPSTDLVPSLVPNRAFPFIKHAEQQAALGLHKPVGLILASAYILGAACQLSGIDSVPTWMPAMMGATVGGLYAALNRAGMRKFWRSPSTQLNVLITGGGKGIGKAIAREFLRSGDKVFITSRTVAGVQSVVADMRAEVGPGVVMDGTDCNVSSSASVARLAAYAKSKLGRIDVWINNAGYSGSFQAFVDSSPEQLQQVVSTNMVGTLLCTRAAMQVMQNQTGGGHIFNMDGAGADGMPTPQYAAYGATKAGIAHLMKSLKAEASSKTVGVHTLSPGMVLTNLLLEGATLENKQIFNILCEQPETVAAYLVPRVRTVVARQSSSSYIKYLTIPRALGKFLTAPTKANKYFNKQGEPVYLPERERILGQKKKVTARLADRAARRSHALALAYSTSMAASYLMILADAMARTKIV